MPARLFRRLLALCLSAILSTFAFAAESAISAARRSRDWEALDLLASALGVGQSPADRGAWAAICEALCSGGLIRGAAE